MIKYFEQFRHVKLERPSLIFVFFITFFSLMPSNIYAKSFRGSDSHLKDFKGIFEGLNGQNIDGLYKIISSEIIDKAPTKEILAGFSCGNHRWFGHWGFESSIPFNKPPLKDELDKLARIDPEKRAIVIQKIRNEWIERVKRIEKVSIELTGLPPKQAKGLAGLIYNSHLLGDWTPNNQVIDRLIDVDSIKNDISKNLHRLFGNNSTFVKKIEDDFKRIKITDPQKRAEEFLNVLKNREIGQNLDSYYGKFLINKGIKYNGINKTYASIDKKGLSPKNNIAIYDRKIETKNLKSLSAIESSAGSKHYNSFVKSGGKVIGKIIRPVQTAIIVYEGGKTIKHYIEDGEIDIDKLIVSTSGAAGGTIGAAVGGFVAKSVCKSLSITKPWKYVACAAGIVVAGGIAGDYAASRVAQVVLIDDKGNEVKIKNINRESDELKFIFENNDLTSTENYSTTESAVSQKDHHVRPVRPNTTEENFIIVSFLVLVSYFFLYSFIKIFFSLTVKKSRINAYSLLLSYNECTKEIQKLKNKIEKNIYKVGQLNTKLDSSKKSLLSKIWPGKSIEKKTTILHEKIDSEESRVEQLEIEKHSYYEKLSRYVSNTGRRALFSYKIYELVKSEDTELITISKDSIAKITGEKNAIRAPFTKRLVAIFFDILIVFSVVWSITFIPNVDIDEGGIVILTLIGTIIYSAILCRTNLKATFGKRLMNIHIHSCPKTDLE